MVARAGPARYAFCQSFWYELEFPAASKNGWQVLISAAKLRDSDARLAQGHENRRRGEVMSEIVTAGILVIGDEILSGRTKDKNISFIAEYLTNIGIDLKAVSYT